MYRIYSPLHHDSIIIHNVVNISMTIVCAESTGLTGVAGPQGPEGPAGPRGNAGPPGV